MPGSHLKPQITEPFDHGRVPKAASAEPEGPGFGNFIPNSGQSWDARRMKGHEFAWLSCALAGWVCARGMGVRSRDGCALRLGWDGWMGGFAKVLFLHIIICGRFLLDMRGEYRLRAFIERGKDNYYLLQYVCVYVWCKNISYIINK